ncbi:MAG: cysteine--tRNA ligase [Chloroflexi bacterium]|nr:MAG: cysteine--tRNA ligase [Chloroflexota bacterium]
MKLYNSSTRQVEPLTGTQDRLTIYTCGITPYDTTHLGHAFTYVVVDNLIRYLEDQGQAVVYVQNVTDIDDDILRKAAEIGEDWRTLGNRWTTHFIEDMAALNVRPPDRYPRATETIDQMIGMVEALVQRGFAYEAGGSVYFDLSTWPAYGQLSGIPPEEMLAVANERGNRPDDPNKRNPLDFVLWQAREPGEPTWPSPWGPGRPGWHIECSAMAVSHLGETIDIHAGGSDLVFPHHESEIAQVEPLTGRPFVRFWFHTAMVEHEDEKMSKSLGNLVMVRDLLEQVSPDALRLYLAGYHYRSAWSYNSDELHQAAAEADVLRTAMMMQGGNQAALDPEPARSAFHQALENDLDSPGGVRVLLALAEAIIKTANKGGHVQAAQATLSELASTLGLRLSQSQPEADVLAGWHNHARRFGLTEG